MPTMSHSAALPAREHCASLHAMLFQLFSGKPTRPPEAHRGPLAGQTPFFELVEHDGADRAIAEQFISQCFLDNFGSRVEAFMPRLFTLRNSAGELCGAFGLRSASRKLFLEQYLDTPIEKAVAAHSGLPVERRTIVEVGHFSGSFPGAVRAMICLLTERLHREGAEWVAFTGTAALRNAFNRMGLSPIDIQAADPARLPADELAAWGSYYDHAPRVLVGNVGQGHRALSDRAARPQPLLERAA